MSRWRRLVSLHAIQHLATRVAARVTFATVRFVAPDVADPFVGDLLEETHLRSRHSGNPGRAQAWLAGQVVRSLPALLSLRLHRVAHSTDSPRPNQAAERRTGGAIPTRRFVLAASALGGGTLAVAVGVPFLGALRVARRAPGTNSGPAGPAGLSAFIPQPAPPSPRTPLVPPLALVLVLDRSGSMSALEKSASPATRMQLAIEGARRALHTLSVGDAVGVVSFDYDARWVASLAQLLRPTDIDEIERKVASIAPDGGTDIYRGLEMAYRGLVSNSAAAKHVILLTDGEQGSPAPFPTLVDAMRRADITISTIGIASTGSAALTLDHIARLGQGRHTVVLTPSDLPDVFAREALTFVSQVHSVSPVPA